MGRYVRLLRSYKYWPWMQPFGKEKGNKKRPKAINATKYKKKVSIHEHHEARVAITTYLVRGKALELFHDDNFKASDGWC